jgi:murein DD-endopeptidase MepM/ murein hydrolase activator NlpD
MRLLGTRTPRVPLLEQVVMSLRTCLARLVALSAVGAVLGVVALPALAADLRPEVAAVRAQLDAARAQVEAAAAAVEELEAALVGLAEAQAAAELAEEQAAQALLEAVGARQEAEQRADEAAQEAARRVGALNERTHRVLATLELRDRQAGDLRELAVEAWKNGGAAAKAVGVVDALLTSEDVGGYLSAVERLGFGAERTHGLVAETSRGLAEAVERRDAAAARAATARELARRAQEIVEERLAVEGERRSASAAAQEARVAAEGARTAGEEALAAGRVQLLADEDAVGAVRASAGAIRHLGGAPGPGRLAWPTDGRATSGFGSRLHPILQEVRHHAGIDIPGPTGQPILAAADGTVRVAGVRGGYGLTVEIDHGDGLRTLYAHLSRIDVRVGQQVEEAERIGALGSTGQSTGPHLHYEVRLRGVATDPLRHHQ